LVGELLEGKFRAKPMAEYVNSLSAERRGWLFAAMQTGSVA
jgi:hypothetical protein